MATDHARNRGRTPAKRGRLWAALCLWASLIPLPLAAETPVTIFAAASLKSALDAVFAQPDAAQLPKTIRSYGASSALARHIDHGAPADIFISAHPIWMDHLQDNGRIAPDSRRPLAGNHLVLITPLRPDARPDGAPPALDRRTFQDLVGPAPIATALTDAVPAGLYAKAALQSFALWPEITPQLIQTSNVRAALALVALGEAPFGITYRSDAHAEPRVAIAGQFPPQSHPPIHYPAGLVTGRDGPEARAIFDHLFSPSAQATLAAHGFQPPDTPPE